MILYYKETENTINLTRIEILRTETNKSIYDAENLWKPIDSIGVPESAVIL